MMPLSMVKEGEANIIRKVGGKEETRRFLENLGFVAGGTVTVISDNFNRHFYAPFLLSFFFLFFLFHFSCLIFLF